EQVGLPLRETARRIGIPPSYLLALERGRSSSGGHSPVPSPRVLASIARVLDVELQTLLDAVGAAEPASGHLLLFQRGRGYRSALEPVRRAVGDRVERWVEFVDPRGSETAPADDVVLARRLDPLETVVRLVEAHPHVVIEDASGAVSTGPAAIETMLVAARPAGVSSGTWRTLARAAAVGLARVRATREGG